MFKASPRNLGQYFLDTASPGMCIKDNIWSPDPRNRLRVNLTKVLDSRHRAQFPGHTCGWGQPFLWLSEFSSPTNTYESIKKRHMDLVLVRNLARNDQMAQGRRARAGGTSHAGTESTGKRWCYWSLVSAGSLKDSPPDRSCIPGAIQPLPEMGS